jgi:hypothetical protein
MSKEQAQIAETTVGMHLYFIVPELLLTAFSIVAGVSALFNGYQDSVRDLDAPRSHLLSCSAGWALPFRQSGCSPGIVSVETKNRHRAEPLPAAFKPSEELSSHRFVERMRLQRALA